MAATIAIAVVLVVGAANAGHIPNVDAGHRAEYHLQRPSGGYMYGYNTGAGQVAKVVADSQNEVSGAYAYGPVKVQYTAGKAGFVSVVGPTPAPPLNPHISAWSTSKAGSSLGGQAGPWSLSGPAPLLSSAAPPTPNWSSSSVGYNSGLWSQSSVAPTWMPWRTAGHWYPSTADPNAGAIRPDGSYSFSYNSGDQSRQEAADSKGNVKGSFSFVAKDDGQQRTVNYIAGADTGFVAQGAHLPVPTAPTGSAGLWAPSSPSVSRYGTGSWSMAEAGAGQTNIHPDGSYSFSYNTGDHSRQESSDSNGNVRGSYSFVAKDDGQQRSVNYIAGANTGFVAQGAHLPVPPAPIGGAGLWAPTAPSVSRYGTGSWSMPEAGAGQTNIHPDGSYSFSYNTADGQARVHQGVSHNTAHQSLLGSIKGAYLPGAPSKGIVQAWSSPAIGVQQWKSSPLPALPVQVVPGGAMVVRGPGGSYAFQYSTAEQTRNEVSDGRGNVLGSFAYVTKNDGPSVSSQETTSSSLGTTAMPWSQSGSTVLLSSPVPPAAHWQSPSAGFNQHAAVHTGFAVSGANVPTGPTLSGGQWDLKEGHPSRDASYSFAYQTKDSSRKEASDSVGNVQGAYSFVTPEGVHKHVIYEAGAGKGFIAQGEHLPTNGAVGASSQGGTQWQQEGQQHIQSTQSLVPEPKGSLSPQKSSVQTSISSGEGLIDLRKHGQGDQRSLNVGGAQQTVRVGGAVDLRQDEDDDDDGDVQQKSGSPVDAGLQHTTGSPDTETPNPWETDLQTLVPSDKPITMSPSLGHESFGGGQHGDASYSYSYETDTSRKQETSDVQGNVKGSFSYNDATGQTKTVQYTARANEGFLASGDHLPKPVGFLGFGGRTDIHGADTWTRGANYPIPDLKTWGSSPGVHQAARAGWGVEGVHGPTPTEQHGGVLLRTYLPPNDHKVGYTFQTTA